MRTSLFTEEQIITILKEWEAERDTRELCRRYGISDSCLSRWKLKFGMRSASTKQKTVAAGRKLHRVQEKLGLSLPGEKESRFLAKSAGRKLRRVREELGLSLTQVTKETEWIAKRFHSRYLFIWQGTLSNIEAGTHIPNVYQFYALSLTYRRSLPDLVSLYCLG